MDSNTHPEWYLEVDGKKAGPFTLNQLIDLHNRREVLPHHLVSAERLSGRWITLESLFRALKPTVASAKRVEPSHVTVSKPDSFHPPPRPSEETTGLIRIER